MEAQEKRAISITGMRIGLVLAALILLVGCGQSEPTVGATSRPTGTPAPRTAAPEPLPDTPLPPADTATPMPTATPVIEASPTADESYPTAQPEVTAPPPTPTEVPPTPEPEPSPGPGSFMDSGQRLGNRKSSDVALGDLDGDGDLDALVGSGSTSTVWSNDGSGVFADSGQNLRSASGLDLGDLDGDGDLDAFLVHESQPARVWLNDGAAIFEDSGQDLDGASGKEVVLGDLDGDGDLDAFVAGTRASTVWLNRAGIQGGTPGVFRDSGQALGRGGAEDVALGDLDGDGDLDALVGGFGVLVKVWLNDGTGQFAVGDHPPSDPATQVFGFALGDVDGDGDLDAFLAMQSGPLGDEVWLNDGQASFTNTEQSLPGGYNHAVSLADLDGDGDLDAFVVSGPSFGSPNKVWLNDGGVQGGTPGLFVDSGQRLGNTCSLAVALGDLDGDGDLDAFVANTVIDHPDVSKADVVWINITPPAVITAMAATGTAIPPAATAAPPGGTVDERAVTVGLFSGNGAQEACVTAAAKMFEWMGHAVVHIDAETINQDKIDHLGVLYFPGGSAGPYQREITEIGRNKIRQMVRSGGCYIGTCAGALYAAERVIWEGNDDSQGTLGLFPGLVEGPIPAIYRDPEYGMCQVNLMPHAFTGDGPGSEWILYYNGPFFRPDPGAGVDVVGRYEITSEPAIVAFAYGEGRVVLTGPHPEWEEDSDRDGISFFDGFDDQGSDWNLMQSATFWCVGNRE